MRVLWVLGMSLALAGGACAATVQADFQAAEALREAGKLGEARVAFNALLARVAPQGRSAALVRARLGQIEIDLGALDAGEALLLRAVAAFSKDKPADAEEWAGATFDLARVQEARGGLTAAAANYRAVLASGLLPKGEAIELSTRIGLGRTLIWSSPDEARAIFDDVLTLPAGALGADPAAAKDDRAMLLALRARVDLNNGQVKRAREMLEVAGKDAGGTTTMQINLTDTRVRGDLMVAHFLLGERPLAQRLVAYSGGGFLANRGFGGIAERPLPGCAPLTPLATDAMAIVELALDNTGAVTRVQPVYVTGGSAPRVAGEVGPEEVFSEALRRWRFKLTDPKMFDAFWRSNVRVEVRCFSERRGPDPILRSLEGDLRRWAAATGGQVAKAVPGLVDILLGPISGDAQKAVASLYELAKSSDAPDDVRIAVSLLQSDLTYADHYTPGQTRRMLTEVLSRRGGDDARPIQVVRLRLGAMDERGGRISSARALYERIVATPETALDAADPIRIAALIKLANVAARAKDFATAESALAATGLAPEQCALVDTRPAAVNARISGQQFPNEALQWGSEGLNYVGYDIRADGSTTNVRTVIAIPPFAFEKATDEAVSRFKYQPVFRPGNEIGCAGAIQPVRFGINR